MAGKGIILTRPAGYNDSLIQRLTSEGHRVFERPLLSIEPLPLDDKAKQRVVDLDRYDVVVFVSRNAVVHGMKHLQAYWPQWPLRLVWCAMGRRTADDLHSYDIQATFPEKQGAAGLVDEMDWHAVSRVLVVRGKGGLETLHDALGRWSITVDYLETYQRVAKSHSTLQQEIIDLQLEVVILTSGEALSSLCKSVDAKVLGKLIIVVPTERVALLAREFGLRNLLVSGSVSDDAVLTMLASI